MAKRRTKIVLRKARVYVAGPYTKGNKLLNVEKAIDTAEQIRLKGFVPYIPHLSYYWDQRHIRTWQDWMDYDQEWLLVCDYVFRMNGPSPGADREVRVAEAEGKLVFRTLNALSRADRLVRD